MITTLTWSREANDCAIVALSNLLNISYEDVLRVVVEVDKKWKGKDVGLTVYESVKGVQIAWTPFTLYEILGRRGRGNIGLQESRLIYNQWYCD